MILLCRVPGWSTRNESVDVIPPVVFKELNKKNKRRRSQLRKILAPLEDPRVNKVDIKLPESSNNASNEAEEYTLTKEDYAATMPEMDIEEITNIIKVEGTLVIADLEGGNSWRVRVGGKPKKVDINDTTFLEEIRKGQQVSSEEIYEMTFQEDIVKKDGKVQSTKWNIVHMKRKEAHGDSPGFS